MDRVVVISMISVYFIASVVGLLIGYHVAPCNTQPAAAASDQDEQICKDITSAVLRGYENSGYPRSAVDLYLNCVESRREAKRSQTDSLEAEYLERLQTCNERAEEAFDMWMACAYPEGAQQAEADSMNNNMGEDNACEMPSVR